MVPWFPRNPRNGRNRHGGNWLRRGFRAGPARIAGLEGSSRDFPDATLVISPDRPELRRALNVGDRLILHGGGNPRYSRSLRGLMLQAGFARTQGVAHAPEVYGDVTSTHWFAQFLSDLLGGPSARDIIIGEGWASRAELDTMIAALHEWGDQPDAFHSLLYCGALGWTG